MLLISGLFLTTATGDSVAGSRLSALVTCTRARRTSQFNLALNLPGGGVIETMVAPAFTENVTIRIVPYLSVLYDYRS
jgi:hypothetical protein